MSRARLGAPAHTRRSDFGRIYERLDVHLEERGESYYQSRMIDVITELEAQGALEEQEGRKLLWAPDRPTPLTMVKSDGGLTYGTSDIAALKQRLTEERADWILYVVDAGQSEHLEVGLAERRALTHPFRTSSPPPGSCTGTTRTRSAWSTSSSAWCSARTRRSTRAAPETRPS